MPKKQQVLILFPYLRRLPDIRLGSLKFRHAFEHFKKEPQEIKDELIRVASFFRQVESRPLDSFSYVFVKVESEQIDKITQAVHKDLEVLRFTVFDPDKRSLSYEQTTPYLIIPNGKNPFVFDDGKKVFNYKAYENLGRSDRFLSYYENGNSRPAYSLNVYADDTTNFNEKNFKKLVKKTSDRDLRSLSWYNRTYSNNATDQQENLLRISTAFETLLNPNKSGGMSVALEDLLKEIDLELSEKHKKIIKNYLIPKITKQLSERISKYTGSELITKWFSGHFYSTGSTIRHGDEVEARPHAKDDKKKAKSIWYGEGATHDFLNNVYFGKKLFRYIFLEMYYPASKFLKQLEVESLESLLVSDEQRLKELEEYVFGTNVGKLNHQELRVCFNLGRSYSGDKFRIFKLLRRLLEELKHDFPKVWKRFNKQGELIIKSDLKSKVINDYEGFKPYFSAVIDIDSDLHNETIKYGSEDDAKLFYIKAFISFSVHRLL